MTVYDEERRLFCCLNFELRSYTWRWISIILFSFSCSLFSHLLSSNKSLGTRNRRHVLHFSVHPPSNLDCYSFPFEEKQNSREKHEEHEDQRLVYEEKGKKKTQLILVVHQRRGRERKREKERKRMSGRRRESMLIHELHRISIEIFPYIFVLSSCLKPNHTRDDIQVLITKEERSQPILYLIKKNH